MINRLNGRFEVENYIQIPKFLQQDSSYELNRLAINKNYRNSPILPLMVTAEVRYMIRCKCKYTITTATFPDPGNLFCKMGTTRINFPEFKYHVSDPKPVSLIVFFFEEKDNFNQLFRVTDKLIQKGKVKQLHLDEFNP